LRQILHISDVHFGPPHVAERAAGILELTRRRKPDLVVLSGDLTQRAKPHQFRDAREFMERLKRPTLVVPGNHDVPLYRFWERFLYPFAAYRRNFDSELEPVFRDEELLVVGINTAHGRTFKEGRVTPQRLSQVAEVLFAAPEGAIKIVVQHHEMIPPPWFGTHRVMKGARLAMDLYQRAGVDLVLSGHLHQAYGASSEEFYATGVTPLRVLHSGTSCSDRGRGGEKGRSSCHWIRLDERRIVTSHLMWEPGPGEFREWSRRQFPRRSCTPYGLTPLEGWDQAHAP